MDICFTLLTMKSLYELGILDDTLTSIAVQYSTTVHQLKRTNKMFLTSNEVEPGQSPNPNLKINSGYFGRLINVVVTLHSLSHFTAFI